MPGDYLAHLIDEALENRNPAGFLNARLREARKAASDRLSNQRGEDQSYEDYKKSHVPMDEMPDNPIIQFPTKRKFPLRDDW